jgi:hypothetical protein
VFAQVVGERDTVFVVCTAGTIRNDDLDRLPRKVHRFGALWSGRESGANEHREAGHCGPAYYRTFHLKPPDYENVCIGICKICASWRWSVDVANFVPDLGSIKKTISIGPGIRFRTALLFFRGSAAVRAPDCGIAGPVQIF